MKSVIAEAFEDCGGSIHDLAAQLEGYFNQYMVAVRPEESMYQAPEHTPEFSAGMGSLLSYAWRSAQGSGRNVVGLMHLVHALFELEESYAVYYMQLQGVEHAELLQQMTVLYEEMTAARHTSSSQEEKGSPVQQDEAASDDLPEKVWQQFAVCLNDALDDINPLIGREEELERTMQILCRKEKNNPLHIGGAGCWQDCHHLWACPYDRGESCAGTIKRREDFFAGSWKPDRRNTVFAVILRSALSA